MYNRLQYISQGNTIDEQLNNIRQALENGCKWIQLRFKKATSEDMETLAEAVKKLCNEFGATFIINDNVSLAQKINADGVHLGLKDMKISNAREILGPNKIIGGTANTLEDVQKQIRLGADYIGLGPFRFTTTKDNLSPILGLEGYQNMVTELRLLGISTPIYAIGGIQLEDVPAIIQTGIHGIAVSGLITENDNKTELITKLNETLNEPVNI
ncbi:thiamine phosphate synthase [Flavobacterium sp. MAHUQ-51]|uniref:thiamine phosphate synthase n=1 Tax=Flavobacterium sp. GCM10022190 TaxID=3252639 RepID=UPI0036154799